MNILYKSFILYYIHYYISHRNTFTERRRPPNVPPWKSLYPSNPVSYSYRKKFMNYVGLFTTMVILNNIPIVEIFSKFLEQLNYSFLGY